MHFTQAANRNTYLGLLLITSSVLIYEILLTRIFSVIAYYHFAFMAISIAMFGMTLGALLVYLLPQYQGNKNTHQQLAFSSLLFSVTIVQSFLVLLSIPLRFQLTLDGLLLTIAVYLLISVPFVFSGICICLILTKFINQINTLYAIDLLGAGVGCLSVIFILNQFTGPTAVIVVAIFGGLGAIFFSKNTEIINIKHASIIVTFLLIIFAISNIALEKNHTPLLRLSWIKNTYTESPIYEKWNSFSRITISGNFSEWKKPFGWGLSDIYPKNYMTHYVWLMIDAWAGTPLTYYHNNLNDIEYLKYDVTNIAHYLRPISNVLIIGVGGGRDILSALVFKQNSITGVEINSNILNLLTNQFADYTGHIYKSNRLTLINDEARSFVLRSDKKFNIIQMSLIDTWAATTAGAFALSENSLYTTQTWQIFLNHLTPHGLLTVTRYYLPKQPAEMYRLTALASEALNNLGFAHPEKHIMIISATPSIQKDKILASVATILVSYSEFTQEDIAIIKNIAKKFHFSIILAPSVTSDSLFARLAARQHSRSIFDKLGLDITPPTDDKPFFFQMTKLSSILNSDFWNKTNYFGFNSYALIIVGVLLVTVILLTCLCILIPLMIIDQKNVLQRTSSLLIYFASIGLGFMLIEISQIQRLTLFLGHPTYGLSVVLFTLLISSGLGSMFASKIVNSSTLSFVLLLMILCLFGYISSDIIVCFQTSSILVRILVTITILFPLGLFLGMALPLGMKLANKFSKNITPWLWGINGSMSICGSVLAIAVALSEGISTSFWMGVVCYFIAFLAYFWIRFFVKKAAAI